MKTWDELKAMGADHYKTGGVEPVDLYRAMGLFRSWAIVEICQHALRNAGTGPDANPVKTADIKKIIHYAELLIAGCGDGKA